MTEILMCLVSLNEQISENSFLNKGNKVFHAIMRNNCVKRIVRKSIL